MEAGRDRGGVRRDRADVVTNEQAFSGRVFMLVLDAHHVSALNSSAVRRSAQSFIDTYMGDHDIATVVQIGNASAGQEFTGNKRRLKDAVARFMGQALPSVTASINRDRASARIAAVRSVAAPPP